MQPIDPDRFDELVTEGLELIPEELWRLVDNVAIIVEDEAPEPGVLGLYDGIPLTEREGYGDIGGGLVMPDQIFIYRNNLCEVCSSEEEVREEVAITVVHEIAHHFGIDDDRLHELGWD